MKPANELPSAATKYSQGIVLNEDYKVCSTNERLPKAMVRVSHLTTCRSDRLKVLV